MIQGVQKQIMIFIITLEMKMNIEIMTLKMKMTRDMGLTSNQKQTRKRKMSQEMKMTAKMESTPKMKPPKNKEDQAMRRSARPPFSPPSTKKLRPLYPVHFEAHSSLQHFFHQWSLWI